MREPNLACVLAFTCFTTIYDVSRMQIIESHLNDVKMLHSDVVQQWNYDV